MMWIAGWLWSQYKGNWAHLNLILGIPGLARSLSLGKPLFQSHFLIQDLLVALLSKIAETTPDSPSSSQVCFLPSAPQHLIDRMRVHSPHWEEVTRWTFYFYLLLYS